MNLYGNEWEGLTRHEKLLDPAYLRYVLQAYDTEISALERKIADGQATPGREARLQHLKRRCKPHVKTLCGI